MTTTSLPLAALSGKRPLVIGAAVTVMLGFTMAWLTLQRTAGPHQLRDTPLYEAYGDALVAGDLPYRNYLLEYPPAALVVFAAPDVLVRAERWPAYNRVFEIWMLICGSVAAAAVTVTRHLTGSLSRSALAPLGVVVLSPLLLGSVMLSRFDLFPAALTACALAAIVGRRERVAGVLLGVAIATKLYPIVCLPFAIFFIVRQRGRSRAMAFAAIVASALGVMFAPFAILAPRGLVHAFVFQLDRPLQIESLGAALLVAGRHLGVVGPLKGHFDHNSSNLIGSLPTLAGEISVCLGLALLICAFVWYLRGQATPQRFLLGSAAAITTFVAFGKVFSPQYMIWLVAPLVVIAGRRGLHLSLGLALALLLTHSWFPSHYLAYSASFPQTQTLEVLARDLLVAAIAVLTTLELRPANAAPP